MKKELFDENILDSCCIIVGNDAKTRHMFDEALIICSIILNNFREALQKAINENYVNFYVGLDSIFELNVAEVLLILKNNYPHIKLICLISGNNLNDFKEILYIRYMRVKKLADKCIFLNSDDQYNENEKYKILIDNSSRVITFQGQDDIVKQSLSYAKCKRVHIKYITPENLVDNFCFA